MNTSKPFIHFFTMNITSDLQMKAKEMIILINFLSYILQKCEGW